MTTREFTLAVQEELIKEGFTIVRKYSKGRFAAKDYDGTQYEIHVKYCIEPRVLPTSEVGFMSCLRVEDAVRLFITNGTGLTPYAENRIKELNNSEPILNWTPGTQIIREPGSVDVFDNTKQEQFVAEVLEKDNIYRNYKDSEFYKITKDCLHKTVRELIREEVINKEQGEIVKNRFELILGSEIDK